MSSSNGYCRNIFPFKFSNGPGSVCLVKLNLSQLVTFGLVLPGSVSVLSVFHQGQYADLLTSIDPADSLTNSNC